MNLIHGMLGSWTAFQVCLVRRVIHWWCTAIDSTKERRRRIDFFFHSKTLFFFVFLFVAFLFLFLCCSVVASYSSFVLSLLSTIVSRIFPSPACLGPLDANGLTPINPKRKTKKQNKNVWKNARIINYSACCCIMHGKCVNQNPIEKVKVPSSNFVRTRWLPRTARVEGYQLWLPCAATQLPRCSILRPNIRWWATIPSNFRYRIKQSLGTSTKLQFLR